MKKIVSIAIVILFVVSTIPVFAQGGTGDTGKNNPFLPFQRIADTMKLDKAKPKNQLIPMSHNPITWQGIKDDFKQGHESAKNESLRTPKAAATK